MTKKLVSVIIPNYNNAQWLPKCLDSCLKQGELLKEIIVVDDQSTDNSLDILEKYTLIDPNIIKVYTNPKKGANNARNYGFEQSTGQYIQWLDSDDRLLPGKFENQIKLLQNGEADIVYSDWQIDYWEEGKKVKSENKFYEDYEDFLEVLLKDNWTSPNNYLMTRKMAERLSEGVGWNPFTKIGQDREYFTMAGILGAKFKYVPGVFAVYNKQREGTISGMAFKDRLELNQILENRFRKEILINEKITEGRRKAYLKVLNTHKAKACFYNSKICFDRIISPFQIQWSLMHWKIRLIMPWILIKKNFELLF